MDTPHPGEAYPPECAALMDRTMQCVADGDIPGAQKLQKQVSECMARHGYGETPEMPAEYLMLMHQSIVANRAGDQTEVDRLRGLMDDMEAELFGDELWDAEGTQVSAIPPDVIEPLQQYMQALNSGQWAEARRIAAELEQLMTERGLPPLPLFPPSEEEAP
jgi:hypothetical protein